MKNLNITVYVTGSIAIYKTLSLIRLLIKQGAKVQVIMTSNAERFVTPLTFQTLSKNIVVTNQQIIDNDNITHVQIAQWTDIAIIAPASANFIAKMANGIADDIASTTILATKSLKIVVPAMNDQMLSNPATTRNLNLLTKDKVKIFYPNNGFLAEGYSGKGRMIEPSEIIKRLNEIVQKRQPLKGKNILITAGGTREPIDPVRSISNRSSGKMGYSIAEVAAELGANVSLISGISNLNVPDNINELQKVTTSKEMMDEILNRFPKNDILIMSAAVSDFRPIQVQSEKIKKDPNKDIMNIELERVPDILQQVAKIKNNDQYTVGFAAETNDLIKNATKKLKEKKLDLLVANDVSNSKIGFGSDDNQVTFINRNGKQIKTPVQSKGKIANRLLNIIWENIK